MAELGPSGGGRSGEASAGRGGGWVGGLLRTLLVWGGFSLWLLVGYGLRLYVGSLAYLGKILGAAASERAAERLMDQSSSGLELGVELGMLGLATDLRALVVGLAVSLAGIFVLLLLWPIEGVVRLVESRRASGEPVLLGRVVPSVAAAIGASAGILLSVHPLLNLRAVPEGPRMLLNYACEAAGYGWVNGIAYVGAIATALVFCGLQVRSRRAVLRARAEAPAGSATAGEVADRAGEEASS